MKKIIISMLFIFGAAAIEQAALADGGKFGGSAAAVNQYVYRGFNQTSKKPAFQGSVGYSHDCGVDLGAWGSSTSRSYGVEMQFSGGYSYKFGKDSSVRLGYFQRWFFSKFNDYEVPLSFKFGHTKFGYAYNFDHKNGYADIEHDIAFTSDFSGHVSAGFEHYKAGNHMDFKVGVAKEWMALTWDLSGTAITKGFDKKYAVASVSKKF